jgi:hypothetical protein
VGSGAIAALSTYLAAAIWAESDNRWLATGTVLEGMGTLLTLTLLGWHIISQQNQDSHTQLEKYLHQLTEPDPIKRLITEWCMDDKGINMLYKNNGNERYPDFKLYKMIARHVHNHTPQVQLERPEFKQFLLNNNNNDNISTLSHEIERNQHIIKVDIDKIPSLV